MESNEAVGALAALAHDGRLAAFRRLVEAGRDGMAAGDLARALAMPPSTLSANLSLLAQAGLVIGRRDGRSIIYTADYGQVRALIGFLTDKCCGGEGMAVPACLETCP